MGTHSRGPSTISHPEAASGQLLSDWLKSNQWALGEAVSTQYDGELPFLFKVLSINKALSIQAHPTKSHAQQLHGSHPELYRDPNHKPELAIAISHFEGFCGFRPFEEIRGFVSGVPELRGLVGEGRSEGLRGEEGEEGRKGALRGVFTALMESEEDVVKDALDRLVGRLREGTNGKREGERGERMWSRMHWTGWWGDCGRERMVRGRGKRGEGMRTHQHCRLWFQHLMKCACMCSLHQTRYVIMACLVLTLAQYFSFPIHLLYPDNVPLS